MSVREAENVTDLTGWEFLEIAQDDDFTLRGRQRSDGLEDHGACLSGKQFILRRTPCGGFDAPMVRPSWMVSWQKPGWIHDWARLGREWDQAALGTRP